MIPNPRAHKLSPESVLLEILSRKARLTSNEAREFFLAKYDKGMSVQGFYKMVRQLMLDRVIVKNNGLLSLNSGWVQSLVQFTDRVKRTYLSSETVKTSIILEEGEKKTFTFDRVTEMDDFWDHALLTVIYHYENDKRIDKNAYSKNYFSWIQVLRNTTEQALVDSFSQMKINWYMASGSHSLLNSLVPNLISKPSFHFKLYDKLAGYGSDSENFHITVLGDFVFETSLPSYVFNSIKEMFETAKGIGDFKASEIERLISEPSRTTLTLSRNAARAQEIREEIKKIFKKK